MVGVSIGFIKSSSCFNVFFGRLSHLKCNPETNNNTSQHLNYVKCIPFKFWPTSHAPCLIDTRNLTSKKLPLLLSPGSFFHVLHTRKTSSVARCFLLNFAFKQGKSRRLQAFFHIQITLQHEQQVKCQLPQLKPPLTRGEGEYLKVSAFIISIMGTTTFVFDSAILLSSG